MRILSGKELFPYIHGVLGCTLNDKGNVCFDRFTGPQYDRYVETGKADQLDYLSRAKASSGVTLDMVTDSDMIGLKFTMQLACRPFAAFDCYVDGVFYDTWYTEELFWNVLSFELPEGTHRVQIFFPWSVITEVCRVVLCDGAKAEPVKKDLRILAFGDSITQGYIVKHPSMSYVNYFVRELNADCVNQAIGGYYFDELTLDDKLADFNPDLITVAYGTNDYSLMTSPESFASTCRDFTKRLTRIFPDTKILGILPIHRNDCRNAARNRMNDFKLEEGRKVIGKIYEEFPNITVLEDNFFPKHNDFFAPDNLHPNDLGFTFYGKAVTDELKKMI